MKKALLIGFIALTAIACKSAEKSAESDETSKITTLEEEVLAYAFTLPLDSPDTEEEEYEEEDYDADSEEDSDSEEQEESSEDEE